MGPASPVPEAKYVKAWSPTRPPAHANMLASPKAHCVEIKAMPNNSPAKVVQWTPPPLCADEELEAKKATDANATPMSVAAAYKRVEYDTLSNQYEDEALTSKPVCTYRCENRIVRNDV